MRLCALLSRPKRPNCFVLTFTFISCVCRRACIRQTHRHCGSVSINQQGSIIVFLTAICDLVITLRLVAVPEALGAELMSVPLKHQG